MKHVVVDLEMNSVDKKSEARKICISETIEIGAIMLDDALQEIASFRTYVKPEYSTGIAKNITELTGITNEMVVKAPTFNKALNMFTDWCLGTGDEVTIYAWSRNDFIQITKEILLKEYQISDYESCLLSNEWSDFQDEFDSRLGFQRNLALKSALDMAGIGFSGREHDALDDARNTAKLLQIIRDEKLFDTTLAKIKEAMEPKSFGCSLGDMFDFSAFTCA